MIDKLLLGFRLRCPHCGQGHINDGFLHTRDLCEVCAVRFERKSGESAGASIIWVSLLPILALIFYFLLYASNPTLSLPAQLIITMSFTLVLGLLGYRHMRGVWIAVVELSDGLKTDAEIAEKSIAVPPAK